MTYPKKLLARSTVGGPLLSLVVLVALTPALHQCLAEDIEQPLAADRDAVRLAQLIGA
jgi:predicted membrane chloride channel (bestrophin family)